MLEVHELVVTIDERLILDRLSLQVEDGQVLAVLGPSGSGKTTLLRALAGLQAIDRGSITWDGASVVDLQPHARGFGLMFQDFALFPHLNVRENVAFGLRMHRWKAEQTDQRVAEVLEWVDLSDYETRGIAGLSGGEQQRVALARAVAPQPVLLMLDEPLGSLDRTLRERLMGELRELLTAIGMTSIYVTHDQEEAFALADRIVVIHEGRKVQEGTPLELWRRPADEWVARFLGLTNIVSAVVSDGRATTSWGAFGTSGVPNGEHRLLLPPDAFSIAADGGLRGTVADSSFRGGRWSIQVAVSDHTVFTLELSEPPTSDEIQLEIDPTKIAVLPGP